MNSQFPSAIHLNISIVLSCMSKTPNIKNFIPSKLGRIKTFIYEKRKLPFNEDRIIIGQLIDGC